MNLDRTLSIARLSRNLNIAGVTGDLASWPMLTFHDHNGQTHIEPLADYDGQPYRVISIIGAGIGQRALIRLADGREAELTAYAL